MTVYESLLQRIRDCPKSGKLKKLDLEFLNAYDGGQITEEEYMTLIQAYHLKRGELTKHRTPI